VSRAPPHAFGPIGEVIDRTADTAPIAPILIRCSPAIAVALQALFRDAPRVGRAGALGSTRREPGAARTGASASALAHGRRVWIALGIVYVAWGSTYVGIRVMDRTIPPLVGSAVRFITAGIVMYAFLALRRRSLPRVSGRELASLALVSVLLLSGGNGLVTVGELHVPAGFAALLVASMPLWLVVLRTISGDRPHGATLAGLGIGFVGVAVLVLRGGHGAGVSVGHAMIVVAAALCWATGSLLSSRLPLPADLAAGTAIEMVIGGVVLAVIGPLAGERWGTVFSHASADSLIAIAYLALAGSILAFTAYVWLLRNAPISQISTYAYVNPAVAVVLSALILGESVTGLMVAGGAIIVVAVAVVIRSEARAQAAARRDGEEVGDLALEDPAG
jgi:drug/metabolite transporter (DMT)-like permease